MRSLSRIMIFLTVSLFSFGIEGSLAQSAGATELESQLTSEELSASSLKAFEARVPQKLRDFADRIGILSDPEQDSLLRERAKKQAIDLFLDEEREFESFPSIGSGESPYPVVDLVEDLGSGRTDRVLVEVEQVDTEPFRKEGERYEAEFKVSLLVRAGKKEEETGSFRGQAVLKKVPKRFGSEEKEVWELFLGSLEEE